MEKGEANRDNDIWEQGNKYRRFKFNDDDDTEEFFTVYNDCRKQNYTMHFTL